MTLFIKKELFTPVFVKINFVYSCYKSKFFITQEQHWIIHLARKLNTSKKPQ